MSPNDGEQRRCRAPNARPRANNEKTAHSSLETFGLDQSTRSTRSQGYSQLLGAEYATWQIEASGFSFVLMKLSTSIDGRNRDHKSNPGANLNTKHREIGTDSERGEFGVVFRGHVSPLWFCWSRIVISSLFRLWAAKFVAAMIRTVISNWPSINSSNCWKLVINPIVSRVFSLSISKHETAHCLPAFPVMTWLMQWIQRDRRIFFGVPVVIALRRYGRCCSCPVWWRMILAAAGFSCSALEHSNTIAVAHDLNSITRRLDLLESTRISNLVSFYCLWMKETNHRTFEGRRWRVFVV